MLLSKQEPHGSKEGGGGRFNQGNFEGETITKYIPKSVTYVYNRACIYKYQIVLITEDYKSNNKAC